MNKDYKNFSLEELIQDDRFHSWAIENDAENTIFWENWLIENPEEKKKIFFAKSFLRNLGQIEIHASEQEIENTVQYILEENVSKLSIWKNPILRIAASILLFLGISISFYIGFDKKSIIEDIGFTTLKTKEVVNTNNTNEIVQLLLEDGSQIQLFPKSSIRYPNPFDSKKREVFLNGQAFFDVTKNPENPFWVHTKKISTQVLGTSFMVSGFDGEQEAQVQVKTGKVSVYAQKDLENLDKKNNFHLAGLVLTPNQQALYIGTENRLLKSIVDAPVQIQKIAKENFIFDEVPLKDIYVILEKAYGISINYDEKKIENCYLTANLEVESLYEKLNLICRITHSTYEIIDAQVIIYSKGCN